MKKVVISAFEMLQRQEEQLKKLTESTAFKMAENFQKQYDALRPAIIQAAQHAIIDVNFKNILDTQIPGAMKEYMRQQAYLQHVASSLIKANYQLPIASAIDEFQKQQRFINDLLESPALKSISRMASEFDVYRQTFAGQLFTEIDKAIDAFGSTESEKALNSIERVIEQKTNGLVSDYLSLEGLLVLITIIQLLLTIYQIRDGEKTSEELIDVLTKSSQHIVESIEKLQPEQHLKIYYVVERIARLRIKPSTKSSIITTIYPNQQVELIRSKGKWVYVRYFDFTEGLPKTGWAYKKYFKKISNSINK